VVTMKVAAILGLVLACSAGTFIGLFLCSLLGLGFGFGDLKRDCAKCVLLSLSVTTVGCGLFSIAPIPQVLLPVPILWFILARLLWIDLEKVELAITAVTSLAVTGIVMKLLLTLVQ